MSDTLLKCCIEDHAKLQEKNKANWLYEKRNLAFEVFKESGFPSIKEENWKYTDIRPIIEKPFFTNHKKNLINKTQLETTGFSNLDCIELVFINGLFSVEHSNINKLPKEVIVCDIHTALDEHEDLLNKYITNCTNNNNPFTVLNSAFIQHGCFIYIPENTVIEKPVHLLYLTREQEKPFISNPRNIIVMQTNTKLTVIESYNGLDNANYLTNTVTDISLAKDSKLQHYKIQKESQNSFHIGSLNAKQQEFSHFESHSISLGGMLVRNDINTKLMEQGAEIILNGLYMTDKNQHVDNHTHVDHISPNTLSAENYRGILSGKSRAVFNGSVTVHKNAQKIEAHQNNANLLLSNDAEIDSKPQLEIYADDVKCSHGMTVGQIDKEMLFYLRTRAIDELTAKNLLTFAFAEKIINQIKLEPVRNKLLSIVTAHLPNTH